MRGGLAQHRVGGCDPLTAGDVARRVVETEIHLRHVLDQLSVDGDPIEFSVAGGRVTLASEVETRLAEFVAYRVASVPGVRSANAQIGWRRDDAVADPPDRPPLPIGRRRLLRAATATAGRSGNSRMRADASRSTIGSASSTDRK
jgi:hypothetical protein